MNKRDNLRKYLKSITNEWSYSCAKFTGVTLIPLTNQHKADEILATLLMLGATCDQYGIAYRVPWTSGVGKYAGGEIVARFFNRHSELTTRDLAGWGGYLQVYQLMIDVNDNIFWRDKQD